MKVSGIDRGLEAPWEIDVPDSAIVIDGVRPDRIPQRLDDPMEAVREAIKKPYGTEPLAEHLGRLSSKSKVTIAINNNLGISVVAVPVVLEEMRKLGLDDRNVEIIVAGGMHPKLGRKELYMSKVRPPVLPPYPSPLHILSPEIIDRFWPTTYSTSRIRSHDCVDREHLVTLGVTEFGDLVEMNDCVTNSDLLIFMNGFAGLPTVWGGYLAGGVGVATGLGSAQSIMTHHSYRVINHPGSYTGDARIQLMRKHKEATAAFVESATGKKTFYIEAALNSKREFSAIFAGAGTAIMKPEFDFADREKVVDVPHQVDVFVSGAPYWDSPYDTCNNPMVAMVQLTTRMRQHLGNRPPLRKGGVAILVTPCDGTIQESRPIDRELLELYNRAGRDPEIVQDYEEAYAHREDLLFKYRYQYAFHPLHSFLLLYEIAYLQNWASRVIFVGPKDPRVADLVGATAVATWEDAWQLTCRILGTKEPSVMVTPNSGLRTHLLWNVSA
jgi:hypothetical protein